ncbi:MULTISPECIES: hypothetical protein [Mycobacterium avium complex (MAC)]|uniref:hypothetical protein n=1 Tax=Mycobacterium avium complex (MAC) TaxID=120793 RepID=UPI001CC576AA|nr:MULTISPECIES: hypothetical protein [Mycobacterium avium complex (MAC)]
MSDGLLREIAAQFATVTDKELIRRINRAPDFGYDDEAIELSRRLHERGRDWRWARNSHGHDVVEIFDMATGKAIPDDSSGSERSSDS